MAENTPPRPPCDVPLCTNPKLLRQHVCEVHFSSDFQVDKAWKRYCRITRMILGVEAFRKGARCSISAIAYCEERKKKARGRKRHRAICSLETLEHEEGPADTGDDMELGNVEHGGKEQESGMHLRVHMGDLVHNDTSDSNPPDNLQLTNIKDSNHFAAVVALVEEMEELCKEMEHVQENFKKSDKNPTN